MHSVKHTVIAVILLGVSFGLYQVSLTPSNEGPAEVSGSTGSSGSSLFESSRLTAENPSTSRNSTGALATPATSGAMTEQISIPTLPALSQTGDSQTPAPATGSNLAIPQLPAFPALSNQPAQPVANQTGESQPSNDGLTSFQPAPNSEAGDRKPVDSIIQNGVQSIQYPDLAKTNSAHNSQIVQREPLNEAGDQGLIDALKAQDSNLARGGQDFVATIPNPTNLAGNTNFVSTTPPVSPGTASVSPGTASVSSGDGSALSGDATNGHALAGGLGDSSGEFKPGVEISTAAPIASSQMSDSFLAQPVNAVGSANSETKLIATSPGLTRTAMSAAEMSQFTYKTVWPKVDELVEAEDYHTALKLLSRFYRDETLNGPQRQRLLGWLDALAGKVIFSAEDHLTGQPYSAPAPEPLAEIAKRWQVPVQLIANIQGDSLANREVVSAGTRLKEVPGPFHAELKLKARVITLYLGDLYAGRYPVVIGTSGEPHPGEFHVVLKSESGFKWFDIQGQEYPPEAPENGYGPHWIGFSESLCLHAVAEDTAEGHRGCIGLLPKDAADLFSILSETSKLIIVP